jgi:hypothetical protein
LLSVPGSNCTARCGPSRSRRSDDELEMIAGSAAG